MVAPLRVLPGGESATTAAAIRNETRQQRAPQLIIVAARRRATRYVVSVTMMLAVAMGGVVFLNTQLAGRQIRINEIDAQLADELARFDDLRAQRAELRAPSRLAPMAEELGMVAVEESEFADVDPMSYARQIALNGHVPGTHNESNSVDRASDPMEQYRVVKQLIEEGP